MTVTAIQYKGLTIDISSEKLRSIFDQYDLDKNGIIDPEDIMIYPAEADTVEFRNEAFKEMVAKVLAVNGFIDGIDQYNGFKRFMELYPEMKKSAEVINTCWNHSNDTWGDTLEVDRQYWDRVALESPTLVSVDRAFYQTVHLLSKDAALLNPLFSSHSIRGIVYNLDEMPEILRPQVAEVVAWHKSLELFSSVYDSIECDGKGCSILYSFVGAFHLSFIETREGEKIADIVCGTDYLFGCTEAIR